MIFVIDDDPDIQKTTVEAIQALGYDAIGATDAETALQLIESTPSLQVILSDICLKSGSGPELIRLALRERPEIKVLFMSGGYTDVRFRHTDMVLHKPFRLVDLRDALQNILEKERPADEVQPGAPERRRA